MGGLNEDLTQVTTDWVDPGRTSCAGEPGRHARTNTFGVGSIFEHGFKFTAVTGSTASHHVA